MRTGPKTAKGKKRSSQNALRHGLSRSVKRDADYDEALKSLSKEILGPDGDPKHLGLAYGVAEAVIDINRIRQAEYEQFSFLKSGQGVEKDVRWARTSPDFQVNRYLSRAYGRLRSKIRQLDRARLFDGHSGLAALGSVFLPKGKSVDRSETS